MLVTKMTNERLICSKHIRVYVGYESESENVRFNQQEEPNSTKRPNIRWMIVNKIQAPASLKQV